MRVKWGLHPISAGAPQDETIGEASFRQVVLPPGLPQKNLGLGLPPGRSKGRPGFCLAGAILSEVMASGADLIRNTKQKIGEIDPKAAHARPAAGRARGGSGGATPQLGSSNGAGNGT